MRESDRIPRAVGSNPGVANFFKNKLLNIYYIFAISISIYIFQNDRHVLTDIVYFCKFMNLKNINYKNFISGARH